LTTQQFTFGDFVLDAGRRQVRGRDGALIPLTPRLFNALHLFVLRPGELLDKNELMRELWPGLMVEENSLSQVVSSLRRCLREDGDQRRYIHTEPRRGFRFVAEVTNRDVVAAEASGGGTALPSRSKVAVLPFLNLSPRPTDDLLPVGMADSLISRLSTWPHLVVRSIGSVRRFADAPQDIVDVAVGAGTFKTLAAALGAADLVATGADAEAVQALLRQATSWTPDVADASEGSRESTDPTTPVFPPTDSGMANKCALGSIKSMIGHTKAAAGSAGLIKAALSLYHKVIPPTLKAGEPDPNSPEAEPAAGPATQHS
jgi:DNA-binding winged helix-turn-helix (wHTH) protein